jgi:hypothetical protein
VKAPADNRHHACQLLRFARSEYAKREMHPGSPSGSQARGWRRPRTSIRSGRSGCRQGRRRTRRIVPCCPIARASQQHSQKGSQKGSKIRGRTNQSATPANFTVLVMLSLTVLNSTAAHKGQWFWWSGRPMKGVARMSDFASRVERKRWRQRTLLSSVADNVERRCVRSVVRRSAVSVDSSDESSLKIRADVCR